jgi:hypothetical protein
MGRTGKTRTDPPADRHAVIPPGALLTAPKRVLVLKADKDHTHHSKGDKDLIHLHNKADQGDSDHIRHSKADKDLIHLHNKADKDHTHHSKGDKDLIHLRNKGDQGDSDRTHHSKAERNHAAM